MADDQEIMPSKMGNVPAISGDAGVPRALFMPSTFGEAMRLAEIMADGNWVPKHLRQKPGDCLAVIIQAARWGMDPFAVAGKIYFASDRMAFEGQLVAAVVNSSSQLQGRLRVEWFGAGEELRCAVTGTIKGEAKPHAVEQSIKTITTRNSPLWKQSPQQQLGYYTQRLWARLYMPEVLLGVYTDDEVAEMGPDRARPAAVVPGRAATATRVIEGTASTAAAPTTPSIYSEQPEDGDGALPGEVIDPETGEITDAPVEAEAVVETPKKRGRPPKAAAPVEAEAATAEKVIEAAVKDAIADGVLAGTEKPKLSILATGAALEGEAATAVAPEDEIVPIEAEQGTAPEPEAAQAEPEKPSRKPRPEGQAPMFVLDGALPVPQSPEQWQTYASGVLPMLKVKNDTAALEKTVSRQEHVWVWAPDDVRNEIEALVDKKRQELAGF